MKKKKTGSPIAPILALVLAFLMLLTFVTWRKREKTPSPSLDLSQLEEADHVYVNGEGVWQIGENCYDSYVNASSDAIARFPRDITFQDAFAYYTVDDRVFYFAEITGLDRSKWLLLFQDDGTGTATLENAEGIYKSTEETVIPRWIEEARKAAINGLSPGSYQVIEGYTIQD